MVVHQAKVLIVFIFLGAATAQFFHLPRFKPIEDIAYPDDPSFTVHAPGLREITIPFLDPFAGRSDPTHGLDPYTESAQVVEADKGNKANNEDKEEKHETSYKGGWELVSTNSGVSAMHMQLMKNNKVIIFDATTLSPASIQFPPGNCRMDTSGKAPKEDCWVHAVEYNIDNADIRKLKVQTNPWCASGALSPEGILVQTGGWSDGGKGVRYFEPCETCDWEEYPTALTVQRWYATQQLLPDGRYILIGGRRQFNYEYVPKKGETNHINYKLPLLRETTDPVENNLYPFVHLLPNGNLFVFANNRSILLDPNSNAVLREFPVLNGGSRNYPGSAMSALLPLRLRGRKVKDLPAEVLICGGAPPTSPRLAAKGTFIPALRSCGRMTVTAKNPSWKMELMPEARVMGDMILLPTTDVLLINGAKRGSAGWAFASEPAFEPMIYQPKAPRKDRFVTLNPTTIPRMYHSSSILLPDGKILVAGSNSHNRYVFTGPYPTEMRVEKFWPPYLDPTLAVLRPKIEDDGEAMMLKYGAEFSVKISLVAAGTPDMGNMKVTMYAPPFTTHGYSMNQRLLILRIQDVKKAGALRFQVSVFAPPTAEIAPPGYYLLFVVNKGLPSKGIWVKIA